MSALGVTGDPGGWQHAADTLAAAARQLAGELETADAKAGSGLRSAWYGPVADAHQDLWNQRHTRYGDLLYQVGRAAGAVSNFAERLAGFLRSASDLESQGLGLGLHLTADGLGFTLPWGWETLEHDAQDLLHARLSEAERDIEAMWTDIRGAVSDLVTVLESVIDALEDFVAIELAVVGAIVTWAAKTEWASLTDPKEILSNLHDFADLVRDPLLDAAGDAERFAEDIRPDVDFWGPADESAVEDAADAAAERATVLRYAVKGDMIEGGDVGLVLANVATVGITAYDIKRDGLYGAMVKDKDAGLVAGTVADDASDAVMNVFFTPAFAESPVGTAISGVAGVGVGAAVQFGVDVLASHPKIVEAGVRVVADVAETDVRGVEDVGRGVADLASLL